MDGCAEKLILCLCRLYGFAILLGIYAYIPPGVMTGNARYVSNTINTADAVCIQFYYFKSTGGTINVYLRQNGFDYGVDFIDSKCYRRVYSIQFSGMILAREFAAFPQNIEDGPILVNDRGPLWVHIY